MYPAPSLIRFTAHWASRRLLATGLLALVSAIASADHGPVVANQPIAPIPLSVELPAGKVALGERLFNDPQLAGEGGVSCADCHVLALGGDDGISLAKGPGSAAMPLNTPTIFNVAYNRRIGWYGGHASLAAQIDTDFSNRSIGGQPWPMLLEYLRNDSGYPSQFAANYPDGINRNNVQDALITFERSLITPNAPFDRWLRGDENALPPLAREGYQRFQQLGCISCHQGVNIGGNLFQRIGIFGDFFADKVEMTPADQGRYGITGRERDRRVFRVPSLRNVEVTAPYFHDGRTDSLREAISLVGHYQLNRELTEQDLDRLLAFLHSLTGRYQDRPLNHE